MGKVRSVIQTAVIAAVAGMVMSYGGAVTAELVNVDFNTARGTYSGAAAIGATGDFWNNTGSATSGSMSLQNAEDAVAGVSMTWDAPVLVNMGSTFWNELMSDQLAISKNSSEQITVTLSGLDGIYDLHLYGGTRTGGSGVPYPKKIELTVASGSTEIGSVTLDSNSYEMPDYILGRNYGVFEGISVAIGDTLSITGANLYSDQTAAFNGFQLLSVPEPATWVFLLIGAIGLLALRRAGRNA